MPPQHLKVQPRLWWPSLSASSYILSASNLHIPATTNSLQLLCITIVSLSTGTPTGSFLSLELSNSHHTSSHFHTLLLSQFSCQFLGDAFPESHKCVRDALPLGFPSPIPPQLCVQYRYGLFMSPYPNHNSIIFRKAGSATPRWPYRADPLWMYPNALTTLRVPIPFSGSEM